MTKKTRVFGVVTATALCLSIVFAIGSASAAAPDDPYVQAQVLSLSDSRTVEAQDPPTVAGSLAVTGSDIAGLTIIGGVALVLGTALLMSRRRQQA
jgi:LPXTG-motif cell wall-anchored protein